MVNRDRIGKLSWGAGPTEVQLMLAETEDLPITKSWRLPALPPSYDPTEFTVNEPSNEAVRRWKVNKFSGGEGAPIWDGTSDEYNQSIGVMPARDGRGGIELGPATENPTTIVTSGSPLNDAKAIGLIDDGVIVLSTSVYRDWSGTLENWGTSGGTSHGIPTSSGILSPVEGPGGKYYAVYFGGDIYQFTPTGTALWVDASAVWPTETDAWPGLCVFQDALYVRVGSNLYLVDESTSDTVTLVADVRIANIYNSASNTFVVAGDVGPIWLAGVDQASIYTYNVGTDTTELLSASDIPAGAKVTDIAYESGFVFVSYKMAWRHQNAGEVFLYYQRGSQRGTIGPVPQPDGLNDAGLFILGLYDRYLVMVHGLYVWGYDFTSGGIVNLAKLEGDDTSTEGVVYGADIFVLTGEDGDASDRTVERLDMLAYNTEAYDHYLDTGRFDFGWPGLDKALIDITVTTDPLPANTSIQVAYSVDGDTFTTHGTTSSTDGDTVHTFTISTPTAAVVGESFEMRVILDTTSSTASPRVWEIMARAMLDELEFTYDIQTDLGWREDNPVDEAQALADLETLAALAGFVNFENPWQVAEHADPTTEVVKVTSIGKPEIGDDGVPYCTLRLKGRDTA